MPGPTALVASLNYGVSVAVTLLFELIVKMQTGFVLPGQAPEHAVKTLATGDLNLAPAHAEIFASGLLVR